MWGFLDPSHRVNYGDMKNHNLKVISLEVYIRTWYIAEFERAIYYTMDYLIGG